MSNNGFRIVPNQEFSSSVFAPRGNIRQAEYTAPRNSVEAEVAQLFTGLLRHVERVGIHDNFLSLGGDSLGATQLQCRLEHRFDVEVQLDAILDKTVAELSAEIAEHCETL